MLTRVFFPLLFSLLLSSCFSTFDDKIDLAPENSYPTINSAIMGTIIQINAVDDRTNKSVSEVIKNNKVIPLYSRIEPDLLFLNMLKQQLVSRGYSVNDSSKIAVTLHIEELFATVEQGDLRHLITAKVRLKLSITTPNQKTMNKTVTASIKQEGMMGASNSDIAKVLNKTISSMLTSIAEDQSIDTFIVENKSSTEQGNTVASPSSGI